MTARRALVALLAALLVLLAGAGSAGAASPRASYTDIEDEVMCVSCNVALPIAESPQAQQEKDLIRQLVAQGLTKHQILDRLVDVYGPNVLAEPRKDDGVGLAAYLVPVAAALLLLGVLAVLLPRWRRRTPSRGGDGASTPALSADDAARLDEDLARYDP